ncbi:hypothetical protein C5B41_13755 [Acinetobacter ursingii]|uniref:hypothetical protein n=1 Tax=Acinetobacter ursingii TaxID=108980 RepID=UPI000CF2AC8D|nr:hypothetical protein [Acinetobacter ursingii]PPZ93780.1 hypothetical protein C5B41_13755 [Acinetobacter ursingii]
MPTHEVTLSDTELKAVQEVQEAKGFKNIEETLEYLAKQRIRQILAKLAGQELKSHRHHF